MSVAESFDPVLSRVENTNEKLSQVLFSDANQELFTVNRGKTTENGESLSDNTTAEEKLPDVEITENNSLEEEGERTISEDGTITYDRGNGIKEVVRPNGVRDIFDMNEYSRLREVNGQKEKLYWDGYEWRAGEKEQDNPNVILFVPAEEGKPIKMERNAENDTFKVEFSDNLTYECDWQNKKMVRSGGNLPEVTLYQTDYLDSDGDQIWMTLEEERRYEEYLKREQERKKEKEENQKIDDKVESDIEPDKIEPRADTLSFPPRTSELSGSAFFQDILGVNPSGGRYQNGLTGVEREQEILKQIENGNIPDFLRHPKKVVVQDNNGNTAELSVMPDYLAIGTNEDWVRVPITPVLARAIADRYGLELPTEKLADAVYDQADVKVQAEGLVRTGKDQRYMQGNGFYLKHNEMIDKQTSGTVNGVLVAGQKKDIIFSRYAQNNPNKLDYYGFFKSNGEPIQKSGGGAHNNTYVDYSHGARFIAETVMVNGEPMRYSDILEDPQLAGLLSNEGTVNVDSIYRRPNKSQYQTLLAPP